MAAPRTSSFKILRALSQHRRNLHITGVNSAPSTIGTEKSASVWLPKSTAELKAECRRRSLKAIGTKAELADRLSTHDMLQSRAFSIALKGINRKSNQDEESTPIRHFNTSRALKAVKDSSTVDFVFLPGNLDHSLHDESFNMRVPVLPDSHHIGIIQASIPESAPVMKPEIYSVSGHQDITGPSPMSEVVDNSAMEIDPFSLTETVGKAAQKMVEESKQEVGTAKNLWTGFLDDLLGPKNKKQFA